MFNLLFEELFVSKIMGPNSIPTDIMRAWICLIGIINMIKVWYCEAISIDDIQTQTEGASNKWGLVNSLRLCLLLKKCFLEIYFSNFFVFTCH